MLRTPIVFIIFNRPDTTEKVFAEIRNARPEKLYVIADGPRTEEEKKLTDATRSIIDQVDWPCAVTRLYSKDNLGCRQRVISGLNKVFVQEEQAIILEDDCLPAPSFFLFCEILLERYRKDDPVMHIGGNNFQFGEWVGEGDYYFSAYSHIWGWATWRRAWNKYRSQIEDLAGFTQKEMANYCQHDHFQLSYWKTILESIERPEYTAWSYHWLFAIWKNNGKAIIPNKNLVYNIGFSKTGTHTKNCPDYYKNVKLESLSTFQSPKDSKICDSADYSTFYKVFSSPPLKQWYIEILIIKLKTIVTKVLGKNLKVINL